MVKNSNYLPNAKKQGKVISDGIILTTMDRNDPTPSKHFNNGIIRTTMDRNDSTPSHRKTPYIR